MFQKKRKGRNPFSLTSFEKQRRLLLVERNEEMRDGIGEFGIESSDKTRKDKRRDQGMITDSLIKTRIDFLEFFLERFQVRSCFFRFVHLGMNITEGDEDTEFMIKDAEEILIFLIVVDVVFLDTGHRHFQIVLIAADSDILLNRLTCSSDKVTIKRDRNIADGLDVS